MRQFQRTSAELWTCELWCTG